MSIPAIKKQFRNQALEVRNGLSFELRADKGKRIHCSLMRSEHFLASRFLLLYLAFGSEVPTEAIAREALRMGKRVAVPVTHMKERKITLSEIRDVDAELGYSSLGIPEPMEAFRRPVSSEALDLIVLPGVAFDPKGNRLGFGSGLYDRLLGEIPARTPVVGLAFREQIFEELPSEPHDRPVDILITEEGAEDCRANRARAEKSQEGSEE